MVTDSQEEIYNPGRDVSVNPNENSILTPSAPHPWRSTVRRERAVVSHERPFGWLLAYEFFLFVRYPLHSRGSGWISRADGVVRAAVGPG